MFIPDVNELPHSLDFNELEQNTNRLRVHLLRCFDLVLDRISHGAVCEKVSFFAACRAPFVIGSHYYLPDDVKPGLMSGQS